MIGNDVVDLELASKQSNWKREGFLAKVFSRAEQEIITNSLDWNQNIWLLWSMKEAAYKAHQRHNNLPRRLNWLAQQCTLLGHERGKASGAVKVEEEVYTTTSVITSKYIYTSAETEFTKGAKNVILEASSSEAKEQLFLEISERFSLKPSELQLQKDALGMPFISSLNNFFFNRFSLTAHGKYSAYNLSLINCETAVKHS